MTVERDTILIAETIRNRKAVHDELREEDRVEIEN